MCGNEENGVKKRRACDANSEHPWKRIRSKGSAVALPAAVMSDAHLQSIGAEVCVAVGA